ncbi:alkaline phosphatase [bacterium]|nr:MAG: alkaline phosphatase [bacterium]
MLNRRELLLGMGSAAGLSLIQPWERILVPRPRFAANPFSLGVASGEPTGTGVVLWTRLAPDPLNGGGMDPNAVEVRWQIASDEGMKRIVRQGKAQTTPELSHSVHVEAEGLEPNRHYWYQFESGGVTSPVGRTRTAPAPGSHPDRLRFAFASCQNWPVGYYAAYRHMAEQDFDLILHLGDYIYEAPIKKNGVRTEDIPDAVRPEPMNLEQYRLRHALYKLDPDLQRAHAVAPFVVTWDDHEVENNYAADRDQNGSEPAEFLKRRAAAYQAYYEHMPLRRSQMPKGPDLQMYRRFAYGDLAEFNVLDTRQYRSDQVHGDKPHARDAEVTDPNRVMMGRKQEAWLQEGLKASGAKWNVLAQQLIMTQVAAFGEDGTMFSMDMWDGYPAERERLMRFLHESKIPNAVVISGDSHRNLVSELKHDFDKSDSAAVGTEFAGTSISSNGLKAEDMPRWQERIAAQSHLKWIEGTKRGYVGCTLDRKSWKADFYSVDDVKLAGSPVRVEASFVVEDGRPGPQRA